MCFSYCPRCFANAILEPYPAHVRWTGTGKHAELDRHADKRAKQLAERNADAQSKRGGGRADWRRTVDGRVRPSAA